VIGAEVDNGEGALGLHSTQRLFQVSAQGTVGRRDWRSADAEDEASVKLITMIPDESSWE